MEVRRRTGKKSLPEARGRSPSLGRNKSAKIDRNFTRIILTFSFLFLAFVTAMSFFPNVMPDKIHDLIDQSIEAMGLEQKVHAVVIDAGSTGSRVLAFTFNKSPFSKKLHLIDELWHEEKPGLSSYASDPAQAAQSIKILVDKAKSKVPESSWASTPITLKATAGLRLLPKNQADVLLKVVRQALVKSGFEPAENLIEIMNPMEEGMYGWFTVNFLADRLSAGNLSSSLATLDLGGGSTQISFVPNKPLTRLNGRKNFLHNITILGQPTELYSYSYLGLGLMAARKAIFQANNPPGATELKTPCVNNKKPIKYKFQGQEFKIVSKDASFENCVKEVIKVVNQENVHVAPELSKRGLVAFSYFFDRARERNLIAKSDEGIVRVEHFLQDAYKACELDPDSNFYCTDLVFISTLLTKGYELPPEKEIYLAKKINGHETSWALGCAYNILDSN